MLKKGLNITLLLITLGLFCLNFTPAFAQQMYIQVVGGGYRFDGSSTITFAKVPASFSATDSEVSTRDLTPAYIAIEDQNGGSEFNIQISAPTELTNQSLPAVTIPYANFQVKNITSGGNDVDTINGLSDGLTLNGGVNAYTALSAAPLTIATGSGDQPGEWRFYPGFRVQVPSGQAIGVYQATIIFTIS